MNDLDKLEKLDNLHKQRANLCERKEELIEKYNKLITEQNQIENNFNYWQKKLIINKFNSNSTTNFAIFYNKRIVKQLNEMSDTHNANIKKLDYWKRDIIALEYAIYNITNYMQMQ
jgi:dTDP-4-amino-4,6-dideoxygalactose transaminase